MRNPGCILITGASRGIGQALALEYAAPGVVLGLVARDELLLQNTSDACKEKGATVHIGILDVRDDQKLAQWIHDFDERHNIDLVIANAGIALTVSTRETMESMEAVRQLLDTNVMGVLSTIYPVIERMVKREKGQVALMSSLGAYAGMPISPAYNASKAAVKIYAEGLRGVLATKKISVSVICPGFVGSQMSDEYPGPKPFTVRPQVAAIRIRKGLEANEACVAFPLPMAMIMRLLGMLPTDISLRLQRWFGYR